MKEESNNLKRPVTLNIALFALAIVITVLAPKVLNVIYPTNVYILKITDGSGWYMYLGVLLLLTGMIDFKYFKKRKNSSYAAQA